MSLRTRIMTRGASVAAGGATYIVLDTLWHNTAEESLRQTARRRLGQVRDGWRQIWDAALKGSGDDRA
jgi:hypothetical protein